MPGKSSSRLAAMTSSSGTKVSAPPAARNRGRSGGTLTRANACAGPPGSRSHTARLSDRFEMYGNGWPGSTASGVRTGKTRSTKFAVSSACAASRNLVPAQDVNAGPRQAMLEVAREDLAVALREGAIALRQQARAGSWRPDHRPIGGPGRPAPGVAGSRRGPGRTRRGCRRRWRRTSAAPAVAASDPRQPSSTRSLKSSQESSRFRNRSSDGDPGQVEFQGGSRRGHGFTQSTPRMLTPDEGASLNPAPTGPVAASASSRTRTAGTGRELGGR